MRLFRAQSRVPSCTHLFTCDQMRWGSERQVKPRSWTFPEGAGADSTWAIRSMTTAAHGRFSSLKTQKLKCRLILPIRSSEEQWENVRRCRKWSQNDESQVPSSQSGPLVLLSMILLPLLTWNQVFPDPGNWCGQTPQTSPGVSKQHASQDCWDGAGNKFPFQPYWLLRSSAAPCR